MAPSLPVTLIVGLGGLGCPAALALARSGSTRLVLCDDDVVDESNLHRQVLYGAEDVGRHKLDVAQQALLEAGAPEVRCEKNRLLPDNAEDLIRQADLIVEGADNFGTKFLAADACYLARRPIVHGAAIQWRGTAWLVPPGGRPCYRCLFEDVLPSHQAPNCASAGVMGPVAGVVGAMMADLALDWLAGDHSRQGEVHTFSGREPKVRSVPLHARDDCPLCGPKASIESIEEARYWNPTCAAPPRTSPLLHPSTS